MNAPNGLTLTEMAEGLREKRFSAVELLEAHLQRIERLQPKLNAFLHVDRERARLCAREIDGSIARDDAWGALLGVPLSIKSNIDVAGWSCPAGSLLRKSYVPSTDAPLVTRLRRAGAVLLGNSS